MGNDDAIYLSDPFKAHFQTDYIFTYNGPAPGNRQKSLLLPGAQDLEPWFFGCLFNHKYCKNDEICIRVKQMLWDYFATLFE